MLHLGESRHRATYTPRHATVSVEDYDEADGYDFFPEKFSPNFSEYFESEFTVPPFIRPTLIPDGHPPPPRRCPVTYMETYKYITNSYSGQTVVAYQCGTPKPNITADLIVEVPITRAGFTTTTYIPWIELLGEVSGSAYRSARQRTTTFRPSSLFY